MASNMSSSGFVYSGQTVLNQNISLFDRLGEPFEAQLSDIDYFMNHGIVTSIIFATQIGACLAILVVLVILSKQEKRRSLVFILNSMALLLNTIYALLECLHYTSSYFEVYAFLSGDYSLVSPSATRLNYVTAIFIIFVQLFIEVSLVLQVKVVCVTLQAWKRTAVMTVSAFVALIAIGFRIAQSILSIRCVADAEYCTRYTWVAKAKEVTLTLSICFFSAVFCAKLGWSLRQRRQLGMTQFGSMQVIFIGGFQTLIVPAIFSILQFANAEKLTEIGSNVLTITCISLPLTSLWASSTTSKASKASRGPDAHRKFLVDSSTDGTTGTSRSERRGQGDAWGPSSVDRGVVGAREVRMGVLNSVSSAGGAGVEKEEWGSSSVSGGSRGLGLRDVERDLEMQELKERD